MFESQGLCIEFAAAHEEVALGIRADVLAFLIDEFRAAQRAVIPPVFICNLL